MADTAAPSPFSSTFSSASSRSSLRSRNTRPRNHRRRGQIKAAIFASIFASIARFLGAKGENGDPSSHSGSDSSIPLSDFRVDVDDGASMDSGKKPSDSMSSSGAHTPHSPLGLLSLARPGGFLEETTERTG